LKFFILSIGGKNCLRFFATDGKKLTPRHNYCQILSKKKPEKISFHTESFCFLFNFLLFFS